MKAAIAIRAGLTEKQVHLSILNRLRFQFPQVVVHHSPNEVPLVGEAVSRAIRKAKDMGMVPGFPDMVVLMPVGRVGFLEVKKPGGRESPAQRALREWAQGLGHRWAVVTSQDEAASAVAGWMA